MTLSGNRSELRVLILVRLGCVPQVNSLLQVHPNVGRALEHSG